MKHLIKGLLFVMSSTYSYSQCPEVEVLGDRAYWQTGFVQRQENRDYLNWYFGLNKGDWDEGWGWARYNNDNGPLKPYVKTLLSCQMLFNGLDDNVEFQRDWFSDNLSVQLLDTTSEISVVSRSNNSINIALTNKEKHLIYINLEETNFWGPENSGYSQTVTNLSEVFVNKNGSEKEANSDPIIISNSDNSLDIMVLGTNHDFYHYQWKETDGWEILEPVSLLVRALPSNGLSRYEIDYEFNVINDLDRIHIFGLDRYYHLIHYEYNFVSESWIAEDITEILNDPNNPTCRNFGVKVKNGDVDIFYVSVGGIMNHIQKRDDTWEYKNVSSNIFIPQHFVGKPDIAYSGSSDYPIFCVRTNTYQLYVGAYLQSGFWIGATIQGQYATEYDPVIVKKSLSEHQIFTLDLNGGLLNFSSSNSYEMLSLSNLDDFSWTPTLNFKNFDIKNRNGRIDVVGASLSGRVNHLYYTDESGWIENVVQQSPNMDIISNLVTGIPKIIYRSDLAVHIFGYNSRSSRTERVIEHFFSGYGLAVNSWHTNEEYRWWASGSIHNFHYEPNLDNVSPRAFANCHPVWDRRVELKCPVFNNGESVAQRAGTMLHEATHIKGCSAFSVWMHQANILTSRCTNPCSDNWFPHSIRDANGRLGAELNHSMNQIQIEYYTDISEFSRANVPNGALLGSLASGINRMNNRILNPPNWIPGRPRPLN